jgi:pyridoxal phosphate enzyme (YggS family)
MISDNLNAVRSNIVQACLRSGRSPQEVTLVGVTKFATAEQVEEALQAGLRHIAENKVQAAREKFSRLGLEGRGVTRHLIGHLQTNKVKDALLLFDLIHSVDSLKLLEEIEKRSRAAGKVSDILIQLDIAREEQKFGLPEEGLADLLARLETCAHTRVLGLMAMAPLTDDKDLIRSVFRRLRAHFERLKGVYASSDRVMMRHLSMGMSQDYEIAVEEGATLVRVGSAIFK